MNLAQGEGFDSIIEAVGVPATFAMCQQLVAVGGRIANIGIHGTKVDLHLETLWDRNIRECRWQAGVIRSRFPLCRGSHSLQHL